MSALTYPRGTDLRELSLKLLLTADWPSCMECGGPLILTKNEHAEVKHAGRCSLGGNVPAAEMKYVALGTEFVCNFCAEYHNISWYFFYNRMEDGRHQLDSNFFVIIKATRINREYTNQNVMSLLRGMRIIR